MMNATGAVSGRCARFRRLWPRAFTVLVSMVALGCGSNGGPADDGMDSSSGQTTAADAGAADGAATAETRTADPAPADAAADTPVPPPPLARGTLQLVPAAISVVESAGRATVMVSRADGSDGVVSATIATIDGTALAGRDYASLSGSVTFADGDVAPKLVAVEIVDDGVAQGDRQFTIVLAIAGGDAALGSPASATVTIRDDDAPTTPGFTLNDTGTTTCSTAVAAGLPCNAAGSGTDLYPRQDAESGRDRIAPGDGDGRAGFSFRKLDAGGAPLSDQSAPYAILPWACLEDRVTGLTWEVKTSDGGLRDKKWRFSWYSSGGVRQGLHNRLAKGGTCDGGAGCDTEAYVAAVNAAALCGKRDWRLPGRAELMSLVDYGAASAPLVDTAFLPETAAEPWWSATPDWTGHAWTVDFATGASHVERTETAHAVRLVRGGY